MSIGLLRLNLVGSNTSILRYSSPGIFSRTAYRPFSLDFTLGNVCICAVTSFTVLMEGIQGHLSPADSKPWKQVKTRKAGFKWLVLLQCDFDYSFISVLALHWRGFCWKYDSQNLFLTVLHLNCLVFGQVPWMRDLIAWLPQPGPIVTFQQVCNSFLYL